MVLEDAAFIGVVIAILCLQQCRKVASTRQHDQTVHIVKPAAVARDFGTALLHP